MPNGLTWATYQTAVATQIPTLTTDANFQTMLPLSVDYAEGRIYRELDILPAKGAISLGNASIGIQAVTVPSAVMVLESLNYGPNNIPIAPASIDFINGVFSGATNGPPQFFAFVGNAADPGWTPAQQVLLGPAPDQTYALTGYGVERPAPLSATNTTTWLTTWLPDLFFAAAMVFWSGVNKNYGAQADDPRQAMSWETQYQTLFKSAETEEARRRFMMKAA